MLSDETRNEIAAFSILLGFCRRFSAALAQNPLSWRPIGEVNATGHAPEHQPMLPET
jgi:hypothetical protein